MGQLHFVQKNSKSRLMNVAIKLFWTDACVLLWSPPPLVNRRSTDSRKSSTLVLIFAVNFVPCLNEQDFWKTIFELTTVYPIKNVSWLDSEVSAIKLTEGTIPTIFQSWCNAAITVFESDRPSDGLCARTLMLLGMTALSSTLTRLA